MARKFVVINLDRHMVKIFDRKREAEKFYEYNVEGDAQLYDGVLIELDTNSPVVEVLAQKSKGYIIYPD